MADPMMPKIALKGGPYDGHSTDQRDDVIRSVAYFPDRVIVTGAHGSAVYEVKTGRKGRTAKFSHYG